MNPTTSKRRIRIFDTTLRDGEQAPGGSLTPEEKIRIARQLVKLGVDVIEPGFPISSPGDFAAVQAISRELQGVEICGFARAVKGDIDAAVRATADAPLRRLHLFLSSSDIHIDFQLRKSRQQVVELARSMVAYAKQFVDRIEYSPMDATRTGEEFLFEIVEAVIAEGATIINIPDTVGYALPEEYGRLFRRVRENVRGGDTVEYSAHCHNDLGLAVANSLAAVQAGVTYVEVTVNGVGERAGNTSLEELAMAIETRKETLGVETGIRPEEIYAASKLVSRTMHMPIAFNKPVVGRNAFQHEAGIHQDGLLKNRSTYEIMDPERLGIPRSMIILGKHSGRHALRHRVGQYGVTLADDELERLYARFKETADAQKTVSDDELIRLIGETTARVIDRFAVRDIQVVSSSDRARVASIVITDHETGEEQVYSATGAGPIEALTACIKQAIPLEVEFEDMELHSLSSGEQAAGEAEVTVRVGEALYKSSALDQDVLMATAKAFLSACNQALRAHAPVRVPSTSAASAG
ncbi:2-isopropylmalate synthase [Gordoniibacillus kamchatkensis]|uniref:2-isopropylmalate synthase n=1 Tax=Gordoniibacillus kamchatkensis TaxID=1590651 RepID=A0ABR5AA55_9BACL|nr:2-isopropylmalate synthase [Paenibacillus sp. VKM B-2647]KIL37777.1 2-isopropylmalate synthase [Paenibacillus sp. VKM B-2647]